METYRDYQELPNYMLVYEKNDKQVKTLIIKSGSLSKWKFEIFGKNSFNHTILKEYYKYKGDFPPEVKREAIYGIFGRKSWS